MGFDLNPKNKELDSLTVGGLSWPLFLQETGMGYVLGYGTGFKPGTYVYNNKNNGSPVSNDGYKVTSTEAKMMAKVARGYVSVQRYVNKEWEELTEEQVKECELSNERHSFKIYRPKMHEDHLKWLEKFADWAEKSKGFSIH
jgi:hypothetical protein